jgi:hypothetical protein
LIAECQKIIVGHAFLQVQGCTLNLLVQTGNGGSNYSGSGYKPEPAKAHPAKLNGYKKMIIELLTAVLVIITAFYAWATYRILRANEKVVEVMHEQAEVMTRPYVSIASVLEPDNPIFYLRISNTGKTAAHNLKLTLDKMFFQFGEQSVEASLASHPAFNQIIDAFPPGAELVFSLAQSFKIFSEDANREMLPTTFCVLAKYSYGDKVVEENNIIDLRPYFGANLPQDPYVRKLKDISKAIDNMSRSFSQKT